VLESGEAVAHAPAADRQTYVHVARGKVMLNDQSLGDGDGARISAGERVRIAGSEAAEVLLFDLP